MSWNGSKIKDRAKELGLTLIKVAEKLEVSRQTVNKWIGGQIPRGEHLVGLCRILDTKPDYFFSSVTESLISVPQHRSIRKRKDTQEMKSASYEIAEQYLNLFRQAPSPVIIPVIRIKQRELENAKRVAEQLRLLAGIPKDKPFTLSYAFNLLNKLGVYIICRPFPEIISKKIYAFYSKICDQRVVFINTNMNIIDMIFQLLHEAIHAVRDEASSLAYDKEEEDFCDKAANFTQFPEEYVSQIAYCIEGCEPPTIITKLKKASADNNHSMFGIVERLKMINKFPDLNIGGAATNLKKESKTVEEILFKDKNPRRYISMLRELSPLFIDLISKQIPDCSIRKFAEWLGLSTSINAKAVMEELEREKE